MWILLNNMIFNKITLMLATLSILVSFSCSSLADSTITLRSESGDATLQVKNGRILIKSNDTGTTANFQNVSASEAIFDTHSQILYLIDHDEQTVSPITKANIEQFSNTVDAAVGVLDSMPTEQRDTVADLMRGFGIAVPEPESAPSIQLRPMSEQVFRGIKCTENQVIDNDKELGEVCITQNNSTPLSNEDYQSLFNAQEFLLFMAQQAQIFSDQHGQSIPNLDGIELSGLIVYSNQILNDSTAPDASFVITGIDLQSIDDITYPSSYQSKPLLLN